MLKAGKLDHMIDPRMLVYYGEKKILICPKSVAETVAAERDMQHLEMRL